MDVAKALSLMFTNEGSSTLNTRALTSSKSQESGPAVFQLYPVQERRFQHDCCFTGPVKKLGLKCDWTVSSIKSFLDPDLIASVPDNQWFYTGMDCYIHCVESMTGDFKNSFSEAYGFKALEMCKEVLFGIGSGKIPDLMNC